MRVRGWLGCVWGDGVCVSSEVLCGVKWGEGANEFKDFKHKHNNHMQYDYHCTTAPCHIE